MLHVSAKHMCFALTLFCVFASGCVSRPVYNDSWAAQVKMKSGDCPVIDGVYQNAGEEFGKTKHDSYVRNARSLANLLNGWGIKTIEQQESNPHLGTTYDDPAKDPYQTISLRLVDGKLHIEALRDYGWTRSFDLPTRQQCRDSLLLLESFSPNGGPVASRDNLAFGRAEDGSLLVYWTSTGVVFILGPNWAYHEAAWIRFPPVIPATSQQPVVTP